MLLMKLLVSTKSRRYITQKKLKQIRTLSSTMDVDHFDPTNLNLISFHFIFYIETYFFIVLDQFSCWNFYSDTLFLLHWFMGFFLVNIILFFLIFLFIYLFIWSVYWEEGNGASLKNLATNTEKEHPYTQFRRKVGKRIQSKKIHFLIGKTRSWSL